MVNSSEKQIAVGYFHQKNDERKYVHMWLSMRIKELVASVANHSGILDSYAIVRRKLSRSQVAILAFHRVCPESAREEYLAPMNPENFERQIEYLHRNFRILSLDELVESIQCKKCLPDKAVVVTFDDGYKDNYLYAYPILRKYHIPATIFLITGCVDKGKLFWWDEVAYIVEHTSITHLDLSNLGVYSLQSEFQKSCVKSVVINKLKGLPEKKKNLLIERLRNLCRVEIPSDVVKRLVLSWNDIEEMHGSGIRFGAHTVNHPILTQLPSEQAKTEILQSKKDIEEKLETEVTSFSYPNGDFSSGIAELVRKSGFTNAVTLVEKLTSSADCIFKLNRIVAPDDFNEFKVCICGLWGDLTRVKPRQIPPKIQKALVQQASDAQLLARNSILTRNDSSTMMK